MEDYFLKYSTKINGGLFSRILYKDQWRIIFYNNLQRSMEDYFLKYSTKINGGLFSIILYKDQ